MTRVTMLLINAAAVKSDGHGSHIAQSARQMVKIAFHFVAYPQLGVN